MRQIALWCTAALMSASAIAAPAPDPMADAARHIIERHLVDPDSLRIRDMRKVIASAPGGQPGTILCGEYNSKNRMGGYTGYAQFFYDPDPRRGVLIIDADGYHSFMSADGNHDIIPRWGTADPADRDEKVLIEMAMDDIFDSYAAACHGS